ncbi:sulfite exporter TauE/SafE family protein [Ketobacter sp.]
MLAISLGILVGLVLGLTGAGGSVLAVPLLIWGMGWSLPQAIPTALIAVALAAFVGTATAWPQGIVRYRAAITMASTSILTAPLGLYTASRLPVSRLHIIFALVLVVVSIRMILQARTAPEETRVVLAGMKTDKEDPTEPVCRMNPLTGQLKWTRPCALAISGSGLLTGFLSGLLGVGGGFIIVPMLRAMTDLSFHSAVATSLMAITITSLATVGIAAYQGQALPWHVAAPFAAGALAGMLAGRLFAGKLAGPSLQLGFAGLMLIISGSMLVQTLV